MSIAMMEKDLRPTRYLLTLMYTESFIREFFEQNPISQLGIVGMRDGIAVRVSDMSGNPTAHLAAIQKIRKQEPKGQPSLENALEMARAALFHAPSHGTREVLLIFGALHTSDPGDIHRTIDNLVTDKIRATVIGLAAQVAVCAELVSKTNNGDLSNYGVVLHEQHYRELLMAVTTPPRPRPDPTTASSAHIQIKVEPGIQPLKKPEKDTMDFEWHAPARPFDLTAYVEGDHSWIGEESLKKCAPVESPVPTPTGVKKSKSGVLPVRNVPDFRKPQRKKYRAIRLESKYEEEEPMYTSVSHRPVSPSEEPRSETDDEIDNDWQIQLHMERLDLAAKREGWSDYERELRKRWDKHRMEEQLEHSHYLSNSLIRFVRKHRHWIKKGEDELLTTFFEFLGRLRDQNAIDDNVVCDVNELVFQDSPKPTSMTTPPPAASPLKQSLKSSPTEVPPFTMMTRRRGRRREIEPDTDLGSATPRTSGTATPTLRENFLESKSLSDSAKPASSEQTPAATVGGSDKIEIVNVTSSTPPFVCGHCHKKIKSPLQNAIMCADFKCQTPRLIYHRRCASKLDQIEGKGLATCGGVGGGSGTAFGPSTSTNSGSGVAIATGNKQSLSHNKAKGKDKAAKSVDLPVTIWRCPTCVKRQKARSSMKAPDTSNSMTGAAATEAATTAAAPAAPPAAAAAPAGTATAKNSTMSTTGATIAALLRGRELS
ncbi:hypothetical protein KCU88_g3825, partial [Aureobasidium melanogenum]